MENTICDANQNKEQSSDNAQETPPTVNVYTKTQTTLTESSPAMLGSLMTEIKSLKGIMAHLTEEVSSLRNELRQQKGQSDASSNLPNMPIDELNSFNEFSKNLIDKKAVLHEFKISISRIGGHDVAGFLRSAMRAIFTDNLAQQFSWRGTNAKPAMSNNLVIKVVKDICFQKFPTVDEFRVNTVLQKHLIHAKDRIEKTLKRKQMRNN